MTSKLANNSFLLRIGLILPVLIAAPLALFPLASCHSGNSAYQDEQNGQIRQESLADGQKVFRMETFGNEGFWTDAARLPQGIIKAKMTPVQALKAGLSVNVDALDPATQKAVADEIAADGTNGPLLNSFDTTVKLLNANAIIGVVVTDTDLDGIFNVAAGDKVGVSCVMCHAITDNSVFNLPGGGSIGKEIDGPAVHNINVGAILAMADNTRAFYPMAQLKDAKGNSIGRAPTGLTKNSSEADFDAYFGNPAYYPVGMFDDTVDGNGNPMHNTPLFRTDLSAPYGSAGELAQVDHFSNTVYTVLFDLTDLLTPGGRAFLHKAAGATGDKMAADYESVLADTGVTGYPFVKATVTGTPGDGATLIGLRVDESKLAALTLYLNSLRSPKGETIDEATLMRGRAVFLSSQNSCTQCHGVNQSQPVPSNIVPMKVIFPGDNPTILAQRDPPLNPIMNTPMNTFDDKMIVINASLRGLERGNAMPLLMDLARKPNFLHDSSVASLEELFQSSRGSNAPHPFYIRSSQDRADLIQFLHSLDDTDTTQAPMR